MSVYVRWYNEVVEGEIEKENDLFGMTAVKIPIQGVKVLTLFNPKHIYQTPKEAENIEFDGKSVKNDSFELKIDGTQPVPPIMEYPTDVHGDFLALQKFKADHWNHERNMLQLDYWQEYDRMYINYMRKKLQKDKPQQSTEMEYPETPEECTSFSKVIIPSTDLHDPYAFANNWLEAMRDAKIKVVEENSQDVKPRTIGKKVTVTELTLF